MRTTKKDRKENATHFYHAFMDGNCEKAGIVVHRQDSASNPNVNRCQFLGVIGFLGY